MPSRKASSAEVLLDVLEALPPGHRLWVRGAGRSLFPLLRAGDAVRVMRCGRARWLRRRRADCG
ncbi:hypothetical protein ACLEPN_27110, partial [Myxococcus sp. 1LA]